jgi:hypothetical protein
MLVLANCQLRRSHRERIQISVECLAPEELARSRENGRKIPWRTYFLEVTNFFDFFVFHFTTHLPTVENGREVVRITRWPVGVSHVHTSVILLHWHVAKNEAKITSWPNRGPLCCTYVRHFYK